MPSPRQHSSRPSSNTQPRSRHIKQTSKDLQHALQEVRHEPQEVRSCHEPRLESAQKELARKSVTNPLLRGAKEKIVYGAKGRHDDVVENATSVVQNYRRASEEARRRYFDKNSTAQRPAKPTFSPDQTGLYPSGHSNVTSPQYPYPQGQAGLHTSVGHSSTDTHISFNPPGRATNDPYASGSQYVPSPARYLRTIIMPVPMQARLVAPGQVTPPTDHLCPLAARTIPLRATNPLLRGLITRSTAEQHLATSEQAVRLRKPCHCTASERRPVWFAAWCGACLCTPPAGITWCDLGAEEPSTRPLKFLNCPQVGLEDLILTVNG